MRHRRWLELAKDNDYMINYHLGKTNIIADVLRRKLTNLVTLLTIQRPLDIEIQKFKFEIILKSLINRLAVLSL